MIKNIVFILILLFFMKPAFSQDVFSEKRSEQIKVLAYKEDPGDKFNNWILGEYRKDFYVINHNDYVKNIWRFIKIYHGKIFFQNARTGEKGTYSINITSSPTGNRTQYDLSASTKIVSDKVQFSQAIWLLSKIKNIPVIIGPGQNDYVNLNYINTTEMIILKDLIRMSEYRMSKINDLYFIFSREYRKGVSQLAFFYGSKELSEIDHWSLFDKSRNVKNVYLNNCSLKYAFQRIAQVSELTYDCSEVRSDIRVSIFVDEFSVKDLLMSLCAVSGVKIINKNSEISFQH